MKWRELREKHGDAEARRLLAAKLRAFLEAVEAPGFPDVYDCEIAAPGEPPCGDEEPWETLSITLSNPWGG